jgi:hypothetical protein
MWRVRQSRKARYAKRNEIMGFSEIAGVVTVSAKKLTAFKLKQSQRLASHQHQTDGKALILLSLPLMIRMLSNSRKFTYKLFIDAHSCISRQIKQPLKGHSDLLLEHRNPCQIRLIFAVRTIIFSFSRDKKFLFFKEDLHAESENLFVRQ